MALVDKGIFKRILQNITDTEGTDKDNRKPFPYLQHIAYIQFILPRTIDFAIS